MSNIYILMVCGNCGTSLGDKFFSHLHQQQLEPRAAMWHFVGRQTFSANFLGKLSRQTFSANFLGKLSGQTFLANFLGRQTFRFKSISCLHIQRFLDQPLSSNLQVATAFISKGCMWTSILNTWQQGHFPGKPGDRGRGWGGRVSTRVGGGGHLPASRISSHQ